MDPCAARCDCVHEKAVMHLFCHAHLQATQDIEGCAHLDGAADMRLDHALDGALVREKGGVDGTEDLGLAKHCHMAGECARKGGGVVVHARQRAHGRARPARASVASGHGQRLEVLCRVIAPHLRIRASR